MFEARLSETLKDIFGLKKATYDFPGESQEQEYLFIKIDSAKARVRDQKMVARVEGSIVVFANAQKLPYGYFAKCIAGAERDLTKDIFFYDLEENADTYRNIAQRSVSFIYFFSGQYDPDKGEITSIEIEEVQ